MNSALVGAEAVDVWLRDPHQARPLIKQFDLTVRHGVRNFSWFIYRMTNPAIRELFIRPANPLRARKAVLSLLAGDLFRGTPIYWSVRSFKAVYYVASLVYLRRSFPAWWQRRRAIKASAMDAPARARV
jgi:hypothetical protein